MNTKIYINNDDRLGECVECTLDDIKQLLEMWGCKQMSEDEILEEFDLRERERERMKVRSEI